jgi:flagellar basal body-associated protein FliL
MAEEEKKEAPEVAVPPTPSRNKRMFLAVGGVLGLVLLVGVPAGYFLLKKAPPEVQSVTPEIGEDTATLKPEGSDDGEELEEGEEALGAIVPFETFLVNIAEDHYIRVQIQVEFETLEVPHRFYTRQVPIRDSVISLLTQQTKASLETVKGKDKLRAEIKDLINAAVRKEEVRRVYFTQFVIQ